MPGQPRILAFAGSARQDSVNKKLARVAADATRKAGTEVTLIDLNDYELPLYNGDLEGEQGLPENARRLKKLFTEHQGLLISCPEYNSSITPLLKNTIDWVSRPESKDDPSLSGYRGKVVLLLSASPGGLGGLRGLVHVRDILGNIGCLVLPEQKAFPRAHEIFDGEGQLRDAGDQRAVEKVTTALVETLRKLAGPNADATR